MKAYWIVTAIFCSLISFTAYVEMRYPDVVQEFTRLGFSAGYFREELSWAKVIGVAVLLAPAGMLVLAAASYLLWNRPK